MNPEWYRDFFTGVVVESWEAAMPPEQTRREVEFIARRLGLPDHRRILDLPCGNGRHSLELAARGYEVTGVDISAEFIERARAAANRRGLSLDWRCAEMREPIGAEPFDAAICLGNAFGYLDAAGMAEYVANIARSLRAGGRFLMDSAMVAESILPTLQPKLWFRMDEWLGLIENEYVTADSRLDTTIVFIRGGREETRRFSHHVFTLSEIIRMLSRAGFQVKEALGSLEGEPYALGSRYLYLMSEKA